MRELKGNILDINTVYGKHVKIKCVTTNGNIKKDGRAVMGAGVAKDFKNYYKNMDKVLADALKEFGNVVTYLGSDIAKDCKLYSFPTKHDWQDDSDISLIEESAKQLAIEITNVCGKDDVVLLPKAGCRNGNLKWEDVKPILDRHLPKNVYYISL